MHETVLPTMSKNFLPFFRSKYRCWLKRSSLVSASASASTIHGIFRSLQTVSTKTSHRCCQRRQRRCRRRQTSADLSRRLKCLEIGFFLLKNKRKKKIQFKLDWKEKVEFKIDEQQIFFWTHANVKIYFRYKFQTENFQQSLELTANASQHVLFSSTAAAS